MTAKMLHTLSGAVKINDLGLILPHEHLFTDLRGPTVPGYAQGDPHQVAVVMRPYLQEAEAAGVTALVECSTQGVGRNLPILKYLAEQTTIRIVAPTGVYRQAYIPPALLDASVEELATAWEHELTRGIEGSQVKAGFIKIAMSDDGPTRLEVRNLQAAARASLATGAGIASHTIGGLLARQEMDILEAEGLKLERFIWVHANAEPDAHFHLEAAQRGAYVEFDAVGGPWADQEELLDFCEALIDAGFSERLLLSHDAGWFEPGRPGGQPEGGLRGYTALVHEFIPALLLREIPEETIRLITHLNPFYAFAF
jgi:phosphotriesterase-related protein